MKNNSDYDCRICKKETPKSVGRYCHNCLARKEAVARIEGERIALTIFLTKLKESTTKEEAEKKVYAYLINLNKPIVFW